MTPSSPEAAMAANSAPNRQPRREPAFRVLATGDVRDRHTPLLRNLPAQVAVEEVEDVRAVLTRLGEAPTPHLVVLTWNGQVDEDIDTVRRLHDHDATVPLLILQEPQQASPRQGTEGDPGPQMVDGVRDAVVRLLASIESLVTGTPDALEADAPKPEFGRDLAPLDLHFEECRALWQGQFVNLSLTEFRVVAKLASEAGSEVTHRDLYNVIKNDGFLAGAGELGYRGSVRTTIKRIRHKFRQIDPRFDAIRNYPGFGYRWTPVGSRRTSTTGNGRESTA